MAIRHQVAAGGPDVPNHRTVTGEDETVDSRVALKARKIDMICFQRHQIGPVSRRDLPGGAPGGLCAACIRKVKQDATRRMRSGGERRAGVVAQALGSVQLAELFGQ